MQYTGLLCLVVCCLFVLGYYRNNWGDSFSVGQFGSGGRYSVRWYECGIQIPLDLSGPTVQSQTTKGLSLTLHLECRELSKKLLDYGNYSGFF